MGRRRRPPATSVRPPAANMGRVGPSHRRPAVVAAALAAVVVAVGLFVWTRARDTEPTTAADPFPLTPVSTSPYLNTGPDAHYVGSESCRECHEGRHTSFRHTGMGRSMAEVDPAQEPPDATFDHPLSKRRYQVVRRNGELWHRELLLAPGPDEVVLCEYPVKYVVGSGHHSRTYLCEIDGFLVESPATWYTSRKAWGMSPGYDAPDNPGFERAAGEGCLICHAGQATPMDRSLHRMVVTEAAIGCERCHGPGSLHVARHAGRGGPAADGREEADYTIVNPARLPRELAEAVCQQCHLRSDATVVARGRSPADFRPGLPTQDFRADYRTDKADPSMTVVGHVEQLHLSKCYQASDTLTCLTCHSPHSEPRPENRVAYYRDACLTCHQPEACRVDPTRRARESPANDCAQCHMPSAPTEIPHLAFTHHRIGIHGGPSTHMAPRPLATLELYPFLDLGRLSDIDRRRSLGLGFLEAANRAKDPARSNGYRGEALSMLSGVRAAGLADSAVDTALARLRFETGQGDVLTHADAALANPEISGQDRCTALFLRADALAEAGRYREAVETLRELTRLRRHAVDWLLLADCEGKLGRLDAKVEALATSARINPRQWKVHQFLADYYRRAGDADRAAWHQARAVP